MIAYGASHIVVTTMKILRYAIHATHALTVANALIVKVATIAGIFQHAAIVIDVTIAATAVRVVIIHSTFILTVYGLFIPTHS
jgi:hypothetical protein